MRKGGTPVEQKNERVWLIDELRGLSILLMVVYHFFYDIVVLYGVNIPAFYSPAMDGIRDLFAALFIFISGAACRFSRNNVKRGVQCFGFGMIMTWVTAVALPNDPILFGVLHLLGVCMILFGLFGRFLDKIPLWAGLAGCAVLCFLTWTMKDGHFGIPGLFSAPYPEALTASGLFFPFGIPGEGFASADYFPLLPWMFVFFVGAFFGIPVKARRMPAFFYKRHVPPLAVVGRYTLWIYLLHQPVLMGICMLIFGWN